MTIAPTAAQMINLDAIRADRNVRHALADDEVDQIAQSIELLGQLTPVSVFADDEGYVLIAGHKRCAALRKLGHSEVRAEIRDSADAEASERAAENIVRTALTAVEEADAVQAMLDRGLTAHGAAQALGWSRARVTARVRMLELPDAARELIAANVISVSAVDTLLAIQSISAAVLDELVAYLRDVEPDAGHQLDRDPGWLLDRVLRRDDCKVFAAHLTSVDSYDVRSLRLGKKTDALFERAGELAKQLDRYSYGPSVRFIDAEIDQARAAGVVLEFERRAALIVDRSVYRELCKQAIARTVAELEQRIEDQTQERKAARQHQAAARSDDPVAAVQREANRQLRELGNQAHGVNLDLGAGLLNGLSTVDPASLDVVRFFVYALLGSDHDGSPYTQSGERVAHLATCGIRLVVDQFRTDVTKTLKSGKKGTPRTDYGDPREPAEAIKWLWKYVDGAKTAGELYGRALVVIAAEKHACRLVVPQSQRGYTTCWSSHGDRAEKALAKLAKPHLPASLKQLHKAIEQAHEDSWGAHHDDGSQPTESDGQDLVDDEDDVAPAGDAGEDDDLSD